MPVGQLLLFAALQGLTEVLPVSRTGHGAALMVFSDAAPDRAIEAFVQLATAAALVLAIRKRLIAGLGVVMRGVARPLVLRTSAEAREVTTLALGGAIALATTALLAPRVEAWSGAPLATGLGLVVSGAMLASTALVPRGTSNDPPPRFGVALAGVAVGLATFPGASRIGAALTLLLWFGVRPQRALEAAFALGVPPLVWSFFHASHDARGASIDAGVFALAFVVALVAAWGGALMLRAIVERRRAAALALWVIPLGLALLAYARALDRTAQGPSISQMTRYVLTPPNSGALSMVQSRST